MGTHLKSRIADQSKFNQEKTVSLCPFIQCESLPVRQIRSVTLCSSRPSLVPQLGRREALETKSGKPLFDTLGSRPLLSSKDIRRGLLF